MQPHGERRRVRHCSPLYHAPTIAWQSLNFTFESPQHVLQHLQNRVSTSQLHALARPPQAVLGCCACAAQTALLRTKVHTSIHCMVTLQLGWTTLKDESVIISCSSSAGKLCGHTANTLGWRGGGFTLPAVNTLPPKALCTRAAEQEGHQHHFASACAVPSPAPQTTNRHHQHSTMIYSVSCAAPELGGTNRVAGQRGMLSVNTGLYGHLLLRPSLRAAQHADYLTYSSARWCSELSVSAATVNQQFSNTLLGSLGFCSSVQYSGTHAGADCCCSCAVPGKPCRLAEFPNTPPAMPLLAAGKPALLSPLL